MSGELREVIVIGSGPGGYTAALYTARAQLKPLVFGGAIFVGGSLTTTTEVENFPGFPEGIDGPDLMQNMRAQAEKFGAEIVEDDVVAVDLTGDIKTVTDTAGTVHGAKAVIVATGSGYRKLGLPNEDALSGRGVSWCARSGWRARSPQECAPGTRNPFSGIFLLARGVRQGHFPALQGRRRLGALLVVPVTGETVGPELNSQLRAHR